MITTGQGLKAAGLDRQDLKALPGSDARKVALAKFLREPTTVSLEWVARALCMGGAANAGHYVRTRPWKSVRRKIPKAMLRFIERKANGLREMVTIMHTDPGLRVREAHVFLFCKFGGAIGETLHQSVLVV